MYIGIVVESKTNIVTTQHTVNCNFDPSFHDLCTVMSKGYYVQADHLSVLAGKLVTEHAKGASTKTHCSKCHALPGPVIDGR